MLCGLYFCGHVWPSWKATACTHVIFLTIIYCHYVWPSWKATVCTHIIFLTTHSFRLRARFRHRRDISRCCGMLRVTQVSAWYCACGVHANSRASQLALSFRLVPLAAHFANHPVPFSVVSDAIRIVSALPITSIVLQLDPHPYSPSWTRIPTLHDRFDLARVSVIIGAFLSALGVARCSYCAARVA